MPRETKQLAEQAKEIKKLRAQAKMVSIPIFSPFAQLQGTGALSPERIALVRADEEQEREAFGRVIEPTERYEELRSRLISVLIDPELDSANRLRKVDVLCCRMGAVCRQLMDITGNK